MTIDHNRGGHVAGSFVVPRFFDGILIPVLFHAVEPRLVLVGAGEDGIAYNRRSQDVHSSEGGNRLRPENVALVGIDTGQFLASLDDELPLSGQLSQYGRRKCRTVHAALVLENSPDHLPRSLVE